MKKDGRSDVPKNRFVLDLCLDPHALLDHVLTLPPAPDHFDTCWEDVEDYRFFRFQRWLEETGTTLGANGHIVFLEKSA